MKYVPYKNNKSGHYTIHIEFISESDQEALRDAAKIYFVSRQTSVQLVDQHLTDADDWAEHITVDDPPGSIRTGCGKRILLNDSENIIE
jgi:hypothetical protein